MTICTFYLVKFPVTKSYIMQCWQFHLRKELIGVLLFSSCQSLDLISRKTAPMSTICIQTITSMGSYPHLVSFPHVDVDLVWGTRMTSYTPTITITICHYIPIMDNFRNKIFSRSWKCRPTESINSFYQSCKLSGMLIIGLSFV